MFLKRNIKQTALLYSAGLILINVIFVSCNKDKPLVVHPGKDYNIYFGDLHNHNSVGYAKGSLQRSFDIARSHLDFYTLTPHGSWHDMPVMEGDRQLHWENGFKRTKEQWGDVQKITAAYNDPGSFVTFAGFEWHSSFYGDYCLLSKEDNLPLEAYPDLESLQKFARENGVLIIPHHPGYLQGHRGANFNYLDTDVSPVLEIYSEHGSAESVDGPFPYIRHSMGGRWANNTLQHALASGYRIGVVASTDDHLGYPGAYGEGLAAVLAEGLSRESIFNAIKARRTYAVSGDRIKLDFRLNGHIMGEEIQFTNKRSISIDVSGWDKIDRVEVLKNNHVIKRQFPVDKPVTASSWGRPVLLRIEFGWGPWNDLNLSRICDWEANVKISNGKLIDVYPCFQSGPFSETKRNLIYGKTEEGFSIETYTSRKQAFMENPTNAVVLRISGNPETKVTLNMQKPVEMKVSKTLGQLKKGNAVFFTGEFPAESFVFHPVVFSGNYSTRFEFTDTAGTQKDVNWYYVRVIQANGQMAWSSPIWVGGGKPVAN
ncbi:hypothetical protein MNBD_BACTEROID01-2024 [hydrothermal vent metagenome]|uniref:DUF3604 domain-containing protein n=1 Tax=hydrothermal vent metagenome TaxID=652676 RepID=A0A3B0TVP0_9ZZZZ